MAQKPKCRHCETAIMISTGVHPWVHLWNGEAQCYKVSNRKPLDSFALPREDRSA